MLPIRPHDAARWGWFLVIFGAPWSHAAMSLGTAWVGFCAVWSWILSPHRSVPPSFSALRSPWTWLLALLAWQTASLAWSNDVQEGLHVLSIQAAMVVLALAWWQVPLSQDQTARTWIFQSAGLAMAGVLIWGSSQAIQGTVLAPRDWTPWMSHIRLSMFAALGAVWGWRDQPRQQVLGYCFLWAVFTGVTGSLTSLLLFPIALAWGWMSNLPTESRRPWVITGASLVVLGVGAVVMWLQPVPMPQDPLPVATRDGHPYVHQPQRILSEGGHRVHLMVCEQEWPEAWAQVSSQALTQPNPEGYTNGDRLLRYLTSKGWPKDAEHILKLSPEDVRAIENGATHAFPAHGLAKRLRETKREWEVWRDGGNASGHALFQRFDHWQAGVSAWSRAPWLGHGVGGARQAIHDSYVLSHSQLAPQHQHGAHLQHLTWAISGGIVAWLLWLALGWTWWQSLGSVNSLALWGGVLMALSCVFEDTWETQAGVVVSFLALFAASLPPRQFRESS